MPLVGDPSALLSLAMEDEAGDYAVLILLEIRGSGRRGARGSGVKREARKQGLSVYDAAYLELASRGGDSLATLDVALRVAASKVGVRIFGV